MARRSVTRRIVVQAAAGLAAIGVAGGIGGRSAGRPPAASAQEAGGTRAGRFTPGQSDGSNAIAAAATSDFQEWTADYPFYALGANWHGSVGTWPVIEVQVSVDGETWSDTVRVAANTEDGGRPTRENRLFTPLIFTNGEVRVRYRTVDQEGNPGVVDGLSFTYIDATDGPWDKDVDAAEQQDVVAATTDDRVPPTIVTREAWGANESYRFDSYGEIWPSEYETVTHAIVHHTDTPTYQDPVVAIRSIYYYHAVDQGWGDIGYNYLVDRNGRIYEGRYGGQNVIGGHSYQFAIGSSGICIIGDYQVSPPSNVSVAALVAILAWVVRDLDPLGSGPIQEATNLPTIAGHRDVSSTTCPGNMLYYDLPDIRSMVAQTLASGDLETGHPGGIAVRDRVIVQTGDGQPLNVRSTASPTGYVVGQIANGESATVIDGPVKGNTANWYKIDWTGPDGWVSAEYLIVSPVHQGEGDLPFGVNVRYTSDSNLRTQPSLSASIVASVPRNTWACVLAGPIAANGYDWYQLRAQNVADGWTVRSNFSVAPVNTSPNAKFAVGATVQGTSTVNIRPRPGIAQTVSATVGAGVPFTITQPPIGVTDYIWYGVYGSFGGGWVVENNLVTAGSPGGGDMFAVGDTIRVTSAVNFRTAPSTSASVISLLAAGTTGTVVGGPQTANGYTWWQFRTSGGSVGWSIQDSLAKTTGTTTTTTTTTTPAPGTNKFAAGDSLRVTEAMNFRSAPGTSASIIAQLPAGTTGTVLAGPQSANGYLWYQFRTSGGTTGWGAQDWLEKVSGTTTTTTTTPAPSGKFLIGDSLRVTEAVNFRSGAGTSASVIAVLAAGTTGTVTGGPTSANGYIWWQFRTSGGTIGWAVQDWLENTSGTTTTTTTTTTPAPGTGKFAIGDAIVATEPVNIRSGAGTSNPVVTFANAGGTATVLGGPQMANGLRWWNIRTSGGTAGWSIEDPWEKQGSTTTPAPGKFAIGNAIRVTEAVNFRSAAGTSASVVAVLAAGTTGTITAGPTSANGYIWWQFRTSGGTLGWAVQDWLAKQ